MVSFSTFSTVLGPFVSLVMCTHEWWVASECGLPGSLDEAVEILGFDEQAPVEADAGQVASCDEPPD